MFFLTKKDLQDLVTLADNRQLELKRDYFMAGDHFGITKEMIDEAGRMRDNFQDAVNMLTRHGGVAFGFNDSLSNMVFDETNE